MTNIYYLKPSNKKEKKYMIELPTGKIVHFGAKGYSDFTIHKDYERMKRYENRHKTRENWKRSGIGTAGFWSKWILWNKPSLAASVRDTEDRFNIRIVRKK